MLYLKETRNWSDATDHMHAFVLFMLIFKKYLYTFLIERAFQRKRVNDFIEFLLLETFANKVLCKRIAFAKFKNI